VEHLIDSRHDIILSMGAIASYDPDSSATAHPLVFHPGIPILDKQHDGKLSTLIASCRLVELFSDPAYEISPAKYRRLSMYDPRLVEQYHTKLHE